MDQQPYSYHKITTNHQPIFGNYYLANDTDKIIGLMLVAKNHNQLYFVKFFELTNDDGDLQSYFHSNLLENPNFDWFSTKLFLSFLDQLLEKNLKLNQVESIEAMFEQNPLVNLYKINQANFKNVGFIKEFNKADQLEMVSKLLYRNHETRDLTDDLLIHDLTDSQTYLLDSLFDND